ncbi:NADH dehydrogenase [ubiquinone] 1 alpha subcomplex subunit [Mycena chlorophos]|uniref:NADH-ubiquinone oxidoreductase subunit n=2 Tax=Mycena chlorophos TaxID=658473 RepID=A0ABQ0LGI5_MYCCL|nr:NADH dehydrogenase [ubiquinone] 1 alpha subcomplex subunit [Mycena chlorophos]GAT50225.1 NADH-ubiquinone oxidoreductase subunit [Mycena chlorophos]
MPSLQRYLRSIYRVGLRAWWRQLNYIGDAKSGRFVGADQFGNKYFENYNAEEEVPGRQRWVDYAQHHYHASQVPPEWHAWISHIRKDPPTEDPIVQASYQPWQLPWTENLTGTRGAYKPYNTAAPKIKAWEPTTAPRA